MIRLRMVYGLAVCMVLPVLADGQVSVQGGVHIGRTEHRVVDAAVLVPASGTLFGGTLGVTIRNRIELRGEVRGGRLATPAGPSIDDHNLAELLVSGGMRLRPWLVLQSGLAWRNFSNALARQHWTTWHIGAEARVPLAFETVRGVVRGSWMPVVTVSGLARPEIALAAAVGVDWRGPRLGVSALYAFERYDFPPNGGTRRLEELSSLQIRLNLWLTSE